MEGEVVKYAMKSPDGRALKKKKKKKAFGLGFLVFLFHNKLWEKKKQQTNKQHPTHQTKCNNNKYSKPQILRPAIKQN